MPKRGILILIVFTGVILIAGGIITNFLRRQYVVPILMYHHFSGLKHLPKNRLVVSVKTFERQMAFLKKHNYNVVSLEALAALLQGAKEIPPKTVAITIDDGSRDNFTHAFPVLKKYNLPATLFIIINEVGRIHNGKRDRLSWDEIKVMRDSGLITFGSHCLGPEPLINLKSEEEIKKEIFDSKKILQDKLAREVSFFSYPEGKFNAKIRKLVIDAGYKLAVATNLGKRYPNNDIFALKRLRISETSRNLFVFCIESSGFYTFIKEHRDDE